MPGARVSPGGSAGLGSWSVSATTSRPRARARAITSAGPVVPSEALLWVCRSMRTRSCYAGNTDGRQGLTPAPPQGGGGPTPSTPRGGGELAELAQLEAPLLVVEHRAVGVLLLRLDVQHR